MAVFEFQCSGCGLRVEKLFRKDAPDNIDCPNCGDESSRQLASFGFQFADGKVPGNTGVYSLDSSIDRRVGRDAKNRWEAIKDRDSEKHRVRHDAGGNVSLGLNGAGEYVPITPDRMEKLRQLHTEHAEARRAGVVNDLAAPEIDSAKSAKSG